MNFIISCGSWQMCSDMLLSCFHPVYSTDLRHYSFAHFHFSHFPVFPLFIAIKAHCTPIVHVICFPCNFFFRFFIFKGAFNECSRKLA